LATSITGKRKVRDLSEETLLRGKEGSLSDLFSRGTDDRGETQPRDQSRKKKGASSVQKSAKRVLVEDLGCNPEGGGISLSRALS